MELQLTGGFLSLLLFTWLPAGLTHQISATVDMSVGLDLILQCLPQASLSSTTREVTWFNVTRNDEEKQNEGGVKMKSNSSQLIFASVNKTHGGMYTCRVENTKNTPKNSRFRQSRGGTKRSQQVNPVIIVYVWQCKFEICLENLTVHVKLYGPECLEVSHQTNTEALGQNSTDLIRSGTCRARTGTCRCSIFIQRPNLTDSGNSTQATAPSCGPAGPQTNVTGKIWTGLDLPPCILLGLAVGTLLYMPIIGFLLWQCRRNRTGKLTSREVAEENQLSMAAPVTGTEDLTYANLKFEKKESKPVSSNVIYTEIKPLQQKQSGGDASAASTGVDVSPKKEGK